MLSTSHSRTSLPVIFQDESLIVINKPAGLLVHKSPIDRHEHQYAMKVVRDQIGQWVYPVHRLDKPTSGVLVFALQPEIARELGLQFMSQSVKKRYLAVVRGYTALGGIIDHPIKETAMFKSDKKKYEEKTAKDAVSLYHRIARLEVDEPIDRYPCARYSLLAVHPLSGRQHQIRRHLKHLSHPLIGDAKYGKSIHNRFIADYFGVSRLLLHCHQMRFRHPTKSETILLEAPIDDDFRRILQVGSWETGALLNSILT
ncbi:MAG: pseudouridine synthase [Pseudomonadales bacterium]|nr:pseudouridine synthase [Pseudomonadales bacterium]